MRVELTLVDPRRGVRRDVLVDADDDTPTGDVLDLLIPDRDPRTLYLHGRALDPARPISCSGLKQGSLLVVDDASASVLDEPEGQAEIRVVSGPGAGTVHRIPVGEAGLGSGPGCVIALPDARVPLLCLSVILRFDGVVTVRPADASGGIALEGEDLAEDEETLWPPGALLSVGATRLELTEVTVPDAAVQDSPEPGWCDYNRPPRLLPPDLQARFTLPAAPAEPASRGLPWLMVVIPVVLAVAMASLFHQVAMLAMAVFSPALMLGNHLQSQRQGRRSHRAQVADHRERTAHVEAEVTRAVLAERRARRLAALDPALVLLLASGPRMRLWERRSTDPDHLCLRLGVGDLESRVTVSDPAQPEHRRTSGRTAHDVPVTVALAERGVIGIAAAGDLPRRLACWAVAQLAVLQSPRDVRLSVLTDPEGAPAWEWLRWVPHARLGAGAETQVALGVDTETCARRVAELTRELASRQRAATRAATDERTRPDVVVVLDGARRLRSLPGVPALLRQGPAVGIYAIAVDADERLLPEEAGAVVLPSGTGLALRQHRVTVVDDITPDLVEGPWLQRLARMLAPLRDISGNDRDPVLPATCRLTEVLGLEPVSAEAIRSRWERQPRSTAATVGVSLDGPFRIDLVEDGPHGLVAGTTGSGKSELLQTLVASLAVANRPDAMAFVLVDYKGGAAFKDCVRLPHTVGMVTDLDGHLVERALVSLRAELARRERLLASADAKDLDAYVAASSRQRLPDLPRLLIVIDEFASLARELPDFVSGLVDIAQRGRSLGIHLILATQRPGAVVSAEIRANTNLRIALRVTDTSESTDVIDAPDSGLISRSTPGRAHVRLGAGSLVPFQAGHLGGRRPGSTARVPGPPLVADLPLAAVIRPPALRPDVTATDGEITDLQVLVQAVVSATESLGLPAPHQPWLPPLGTDLLLPDLLERVVRPVTPRIAAAPYAVEDLPARQERRPAVIDLAVFSHLSIFGGPRSGRSQALRTIAASLARLASPADVHLYGLDCGNGALLPVQALPHCGAVVQRTQTDRATRLLSRLVGELGRRQEVLARGGYADLTELRAHLPPDERMPHLLLLLDRWEGFLGTVAELDAGRPLDQVQTLLREGASAGLHLVLTGDRQLVNSRMGALVEDKIGLRVPDRSDYGLIGLSPRKLPDSVPQGRGFRSDSGVELQFVLLCADPRGRAQASELRRIGHEETERHLDLPRAARPFRVDMLPGRIGFEEAWALRADTRGRPLWAMVGVAGDELAAVGLDLARSNGAIVAGPPRSGRSTVLLSAVESLRRGGADVVIAAPRRSPLRALAGQDGVRHVFTGTQITRDALEPLLDPAERPVVLVVDDGELLKDVAAKDYLRTVLRGGADRGQAILLAGDSSEVASGFTGWQVETAGRQGVLTSPRAGTEGELIGARIPRGSTGAPAQIGRVLASTGDGALRTLQVPLPPA